jgi:hypothetical protein
LFETAYPPRDFSQDNRPQLGRANGLPDICA